jgi:hypothetical protein
LFQNLIPAIWKIAIWVISLAQLLFRRISKIMRYIAFLFCILICWFFIGIENSYSQTGASANYVITGDIPTGTGLYTYTITMHPSMPDGCLESPCFDPSNSLFSIVTSLGVTYTLGTDYTMSASPDGLPVEIDFITYPIPLGTRITWVNTAWWPLASYPASCENLSGYNCRTLVAMDKNIGSNDPPSTSGCLHDCAYFNMLNGNFETDDTNITGWTQRVKLANSDNYQTIGSSLAGSPCDNPTEFDNCWQQALDLYEACISAPELGVDCYENWLQAQEQCRLDYCGNIQSEFEQTPVGTETNDAIAPSISVVAPDIHLPTTNEHSLRLGAAQTDFLQARTSQDFYVQYDNTIINYVHAPVLQKLPDVPETEGLATSLDVKFYALIEGVWVLIYNKTIRSTDADLSTITDPTTSNSYAYSEWRNSFVNLSNYVGVKVRVVFETHDVVFDNETYYAYAYLDINCSNCCFSPQPLAITDITISPTASTCSAELTPAVAASSCTSCAPIFVYQWETPDGETYITTGSEPFVKIQNGAHRVRMNIVEGDIFNCCWSDWTDINVNLPCTIPEIDVFFNCDNDTYEVRASGTLATTRRNADMIDISVFSALTAPFYYSIGESFSQTGMICAPTYQLNEVLNVSASTLSDDWIIPTGQIDKSQVNANDVVDFLQTGNPFRTGEKGVWRLSDSYAYVTDRIGEGDIPEVEAEEGVAKDGGVFELKMFNWQNDKAQTEEWRRVSRATQYNPYGYGTEQRDVLGRYGAAIYGYKGQLLTANAGNAMQREIAYEGFEDNSEVSNFQLASGIPSGLKNQFSFEITWARGDRAVVYHKLNENLLNTANVRIKGFRADTKTYFELSGVNISIDERTRTSATVTLSTLPDGFTVDTEWWGTIQINSALPAFGSTYIDYTANITDQEAHTGKKSFRVSDEVTLTQPFLDLQAEKEYLFSAWVKRTLISGQDEHDYGLSSSSGPVMISISGGGIPTPFVLYPSGPIIEGWQRIEGTFCITEKLTEPFHITFFHGGEPGSSFFDDIRVQPAKSSMTSYVYDPITYRIEAVLDENNYATFYFYDYEGKLHLTQKESLEGIITTQEAMQHLMRRD